MKVHTILGRRVIQVPDGGAMHPHGCGECAFQTTRKCHLVQERAEELHIPMCFENSTHFEPVPALTH